MNLSIIREKYMQNAAETRKLYAKYNDYTQKIQFNFITIHKTQILSQCKRYKFYINSQYTIFITMQKIQIL